MNMESPLFFGIFALIGLAAFGTWIIALVDVLKSEFRGQNDKLLWAIVIVLGGVIGAILYFVIGRNQKRWQ
jgi:hypothetical protein